MAGHNYSRLRRAVKPLTGPPHHVSVRHSMLPTAAPDNSSETQRRSSTLFGTCLGSPNNMRPCQLLWGHMSRTRTAVVDI